MTDEHLGRIERLEERIDDLEDALKEAAQARDRLLQEIGGTSLAAPGLALRLDRLERRVSSVLGMLGWLMSGGGLAVIAFLVMLYRLLGLLTSAEAQ